MFERSEFRRFPLYKRQKMILAREQSEVVASLTAPPDYHEPTVVILLIRLCVHDKGTKAPPPYSPRHGNKPL